MHSYICLLDSYFPNERCCKSRCNAYYNICEAQSVLTAAHHGQSLIAERGESGEAAAQPNNKQEPQVGRQTVTGNP